TEYSPLCGTLLFFPGQLHPWGGNRRVLRFDYVWWTDTCTSCRRVTGRRILRRYPQNDTIRLGLVYDVPPSRGAVGHAISSARLTVAQNSLYSSSVIRPA